MCLRATNRGALTADHDQSHNVMTCIPRNTTSPVAATLLLIAVRVECLDSPCSNTWQQRDTKAVLFFSLWRLIFCLWKNIFEPDAIFFEKFSLWTNKFTARSQNFSWICFQSVDLNKNVASGEKFLNKHCAKGCGRYPSLARKHTSFSLTTPPKSSGDVY